MIDKVYHTLLDRRKRIKKKTKHEIGHLVRTADIKRTFSKTDSTNCSYKLYKIGETVNDTKPDYKIENLKER